MGAQTETQDRRWCSVTGARRSWPRARVADYLSAQDGGLRKVKEEEEVDDDGKEERGGEKGGREGGFY